MPIKTTLRFIRSGEGQDYDDVITISTTRISDVFRVVYTPGDSDTGSVYTSYMSRSKTMKYVSDILRGMCYDVDPFDRIQIQTDLHPSIMYSVSDMDSAVARENLENMVDASLHTTVIRTTQ